MEEKILPEDLTVLSAYKATSQTKLLEAQKAIADSKAADLEYRNQILRLFVKYKMQLDDGFDDSTGVITRIQETHEEEPKIEIKEDK